MMNIKHKFVDTIPKQLEEKVLYITIQYSTAVHKCFCGCGQEVVTPLSPTDWKLIFDGKSISLYPSIGNWSFKCKSHYWIRNNKIILAPKWSDNKVKNGRDSDKLNKQEYYDKNESKSKTKNDDKFWDDTQEWFG